MLNFAIYLSTHPKYIRSYVRENHTTNNVIDTNFIIAKVVEKSSNSLNVIYSLLTTNYFINCKIYCEKINFALNINYCITISGRIITISRITINNDTDYLLQLYYMWLIALFWCSLSQMTSSKVPSIESWQTL